MNKMHLYWKPAGSGPALCCILSLPVPQHGVSGAPRPGEQARQQHPPCSQNAAPCHTAQQHATAHTSFTFPARPGMRGFARHHRHMARLPPKQLCWGALRSHFLGLLRALYVTLCLSVSSCNSLSWSHSSAVAVHAMLTGVTFMGLSWCKLPGGTP